MSTDSPIIHTGDNLDQSRPDIPNCYSKLNQESNFLTSRDATL